MGADYRLTTVLSNFKAFETLLERFQAPELLQKKIPGAFIFKASGEVSPAGFIRSLNRRDSPQGRSLVSAEKSTDEISATGGHQCFSPLPYRPRFPILADLKPNEKPLTRGGFSFCEPGGIRTHDLLIRRS